MIEKVISGGQTGVDQAALLVASEMGIPVSGWCPLHGLDENKEPMLKKYPLKEVTGLSYDESVIERTKLNIQDSDGTLIIVPRIPLPRNITDGTLLTIDHARIRNKPHLLIAVSDREAIDIIQQWIKTNNIKTLNVAGPRESSSKGIYNKTCELLRQFFLSAQPRPKL